MKQRLKFWLAKLNNEQIKHLAMSFRILGVGAFLGALQKADNALDISVLVFCWGTLEYFGIMTLKNLKKEDK